MRKTLITILAMTFLAVIFTGCTSNVNSAISQPARTLPAPANGVPISTPPPQGITVNEKAFDIIQIDAVPDAQKTMIEQLKTKKGFAYWQDNEDFYIVIFAGEKPTAGYSINVKSLEDNEGKTNILIEVTSPNGMVNQVISYPYVIVKTTGITDQFNIVDTLGESYILIQSNC